MTALEILRTMASDVDIVCNKGQCWLGDRKISRALISNLVRLRLISLTIDFTEETELYTINEDGRAMASADE